MVKIAVVVLDTLRKDRFDEFFNWIPGCHFNAAYSTANWTAPAHASIFTGLYPREVGVSAKSRSLTCPEQTVAETLSNQGYDTIAYSANHNASAANNFDRGFNDFTGPSALLNPDDHVLDFEQFLSNSDKKGVTLYWKAVHECIFGKYDTIQSLKCGLGKAIGNKALQKNINDDGASVVASEITDRNWAEDTLFFANLMEAHTPYDPPEPYNRIGEAVEVTVADTFTGVDDVSRIQEAYDGAAEYLSEIYKEIFNELATEFDYIITLSDHGELLGEHGYWNHTYGLYPEVTHVPLVITNTDERQNQIVETPVSLLDIYQTIRDIAGLDQQRRGQSLINVDSLKPSDLLAEYRGLISIARERLFNTGYSDSEVQKYQKSMDALIGAEGGYWVFQDEQIVFPEDISETDVFDRLKILTEDLDEVQIDKEDEVSEQVRSQLEDLGYA